MPEDFKIRTAKA